MKAPSGYGSIAKMSGKRRNPFRVQITTGWETVKNKDGNVVPKRIRKTLGYFPTRQAAMIALAEYNKSPYDLNVNTITWLEVWNKWGPDLIANTKTSRAQTLNKAHERCSPLYDMKMKDIRKGHMQDIIDSISHMNLTSQHAIKYIMQHNFKWALENDIVMKDYSQFLTVTAPEKEKDLHFPLAVQEIQALWKKKDELTTIPVGQKGKTTIPAAKAMLVLIYTGMRVMELGELKTEDVHLEERYIDLQGTKTKAAKRLVPLHKDIIPVISELLADGGEYLFVDGNKKPLNYNRWTAYVITESNKITGTTHTLHDTRHTFVSAAERSGISADSVILKRIVGHSTAANMTARYTHKDIGDLLAAIDTISLI